MRVDSRVMERDVSVARARMFGAMVAGVLLMAGCGMVTVVSEEALSDYALCIEKREAGVCHLSLQRSTVPRWQSERVTNSFKRRGTWAFFQEYRTS